MNHLTNNDAAWIAFAVVLYLLSSGYQVRQRMSFHRAIVDKFSSAEEFAIFLRSPAGQRFVTDASGAEGPARAILRAIQKGLVLILMGGGTLGVGVTILTKVEVVAIGVLLLCAGTAVLISAAISFRLSRSWGLIEEPGISGGEAQLVNDPERR